MTETPTIIVCNCRNRFILVERDDRQRLVFRDGGARDDEREDGRVIDRCPSCGEPVHNIVRET
jgi:hypothetical protein